MLWWFGEREHEIGTLEMGASAVNAFSFRHDVYPAELSEFQSDHLADDPIASAIRRHHSHSVLHRVELRMDAGDSVPRLFALWIPAPVGFEAVAA